MFHVKQSNGMKFVVADSMSLFDFLKEKYPDVSRTRLKEMLAREIIVDGKRVSKFDYNLLPGMKVIVEKSNRNNSPYGMDIVYEDNYLVVVNKHCGILSNSTNRNDTTVITELNRFFEFNRKKYHAHIIHRLDRDTSGLMVVGKSKEVARRFECDWKGMVYDRIYVAVAWGTLTPKKGTIVSWLTDGEYCVLSSPTDNGGKKAVTNYEVIQCKNGYSLVRLKLDTGRRNQIRVHLREMGHPVVHDSMYGYKDDKSPIGRLALHASRLCFIHPITGKKMEFEDEIPEIFCHLMGIKKMVRDEKKSNSLKKIHTKKSI